MIYVGSTDGNFYAVDIQSGTLKWKFDAKSRVVSSATVRLLEARFHPGSKSAPSAVIVGRVSCDGRVALVEPLPFQAEAVKPFEPIALFHKLEFLVASAVGDTFQALVTLRSAFWSFVEVEDERRGAGT